MFMIEPSEVHLRINTNPNPEFIFYRQKIGKTIKVHPDYDLVGSTIVMYTNYPQDEDTEGNNRLPLKWYDGNSQMMLATYNDAVFVMDTDIYVEIKMNTPGTYKFWFQYADDLENDVPAGEVYIQIEPILRAGTGRSSILIPLDAVRCQTVISKCLGPIDTWCSKLVVAKECEYNAIHFTPIQTLGASNSAYSIKDQLSINPLFARSTSSQNQPATFDDVRSVIKICREKWKMLTICDVVLNHTANDSEWLVDHPEATYNCSNCPYLRPACLMDIMLAKCENDIISGALTTRGIPPLIDSEEHMEALKEVLAKIYLPQVKLHELYQCNIASYVKDFTDYICNCKAEDINPFDVSRFDEILLSTDPDFKRLGGTIEFDLALEVFNMHIPDCLDEENRRQQCIHLFQDHLEKLNDVAKNDMAHYLNYIIDNCLKSVYYHRVQDNGPRIRINDENHRIFMRYFTHVGMEDKTLEEIETLVYSDQGHKFMAYNGWIKSPDDPLVNFAEKQPGYRNVYLARELISWDDNIKLHYGSQPEDSPYLWQHMRQYVESVASIFDGIRLDNCHSTPLHVAEYLLKAARAVNPNLYVVAELFTNSSNADNIFTNRLGIHSLIREALAAPNTCELGTFVHRYGGTAVGSFHQFGDRTLNEGTAHVIFMDCTHDNPSAITRRTAFDLMPNAALVAVSSCATGSNRGYDEFVPHQIDVVEENRQYQQWKTEVSLETGMLAGKKALNQLHQRLAIQGYTEIYVDKVDANLTAVTRHSPRTHESVVLVAYSAFNYSPINVNRIPPLRYEGQMDDILFEAEYNLEPDMEMNTQIEFTKHPTVINGLNDCRVILNQNVPLQFSMFFYTHVTMEGSFKKLVFRKFNPGDVVAIKISQTLNMRCSLADVDNIIYSIQSRRGSPFDDLQKALDDVNLVAMHYILFVCDEEQKQLSRVGVYHIPDYGPLKYCGLQGFVSVLAEIYKSNDLGHPLCSNLRNGNWMLDFITNRLKHNVDTAAFAHWLRQSLDALKTIPRYLIPCKFDAIITGVYNILADRVCSLMPDFIKNGRKFTRSLALATLQFVGFCKTSTLPPLSPNLKHPKPPKFCATIAAGLPHFSTGAMRCWGRDTFTAIRGLLYLTGRFDEARFLILAYAQCLRHGLIPNLLNEGKTPRYNSRDAVWWWLYSIKQYVECAPQGEKILHDAVSRIFPHDDGEPQEAGKFDQPLILVMHEALQVHFQGLEFTERFAGPGLDKYMLVDGFNIRIGVNLINGFVYGGNRFNCGTWMDKMGSSEKARNEGIPSTPRDGTAVELVGLQFAVLRFMHFTHMKGWNHYYCVTRKEANGWTTTWSYLKWSNIIMANFEKYFYIPDTQPSVVKNEKLIYKDCYGCSTEWADYQFRPNFLINMVVAPEIFNPQHAWTALEIVKEKLLGPLGVKTLVPHDWKYDGNYDNNNDSTNGLVAHGANYHQGPEWIWLMGYYLRARLIFAKKLGYLRETITEAWKILGNHMEEIEASPWHGLPELTNADGVHCDNACGTQAWSIATMLETVYDLHILQSQN